MGDLEISVRCQHPGCGSPNLVVIGTTAPKQIRCSRCQNMLLDYTPIQGYVYVLSNEQMPGLVKVGFTTRDVAQRVAELSSGTGVPSPFVIEAVFATAEPEKHEREVHDRLGDNRLEGKEFFREDLRTALRLVADICGSEPKYVRDPTLLAEPKQPTTQSTAAAEQNQTQPRSLTAGERLAYWQKQAYRRDRFPG